MRKLALPLVIALLAMAGPAAAFEYRPGHGGRDAALAQGEYQSPFVAPRVPDARPDPGGGGRNRAREGVRRGEIVPLDRVMNRVQRRYPGRVLDVRLDDRRLVYHLRMLTRRGQVLRIDVDARDASILSVHGDRRGGDRGKRRRKGR